MKKRKKRPTRQKPFLIIDITLTRRLLALLALALVTVIFLGTLAWGQKNVAADAQASHAAFTGMRKYYLTQDGYDGDEALTACAPGYHMASLWEILDTTNLQYDTDLGTTWWSGPSDEGAGPPADAGGWVRTGGGSQSTGVAGQVNCSAWSTDVSIAEGTVAWLGPDWTAGAENKHVWSVDDVACDLKLLVWCVED